MEPELVPARDSDAAVFDRLMQLYAYEFSEFMGWDIDADGRYDDRQGGWRVLSAARSRSRAAHASASVLANRRLGLS